LPKLELIICPNPKCHRKIERLIVVRDVSTIPVERYYACPHCFFKLDVISTQPQKQKEEKKKEEELPVKPPEKEEKGPSGCPHHFGYLASRAKDVPIPRECLICPKILECMHSRNF